MGKQIRLHAGGWLPYILWINFRTVESDYAHGFTLEATGDLAGKGSWGFEQDGPYVNITYDWTIRANKTIIRSPSFLLKPIFSRQSRLDHEGGEESLKLELRRRHTKTPEEAAPIPPPPKASFFLRRQTSSKPKSV